MRKILAAALATATLAGLTSPVLAEGFDGRGVSAVPAYSQAQPQIRTPLAGNPAVTQGQAAQNYLERSGATGGGGQQN